MDAIRVGLGIIFIVFALGSLLLGFANPEAVIRWGSTRTRVRVLLTYGSMLVLGYLLLPDLPQ